MNRENLEAVLSLLQDVQIDWRVVERARETYLPHLSDTELASLLGIQRATYSDYKNRGTLPSLRVALMLAFLLNLDWRDAVTDQADIKKLLGLTT